jgi:hypothetical protein
MRREPRWCVAKVSDDGKMKVISPAFESTAEAEERANAATIAIHLDGKVWARGRRSHFLLIWFKVLNPAYTQKRGRREMFERFRERRDHVQA